MKEKKDLVSQSRYNSCAQCGEAESSNRCRFTGILR